MVDPLIARPITKYTVGDALDIKCKCYETLREVVILKCNFTLT